MMVNIMGKDLFPFKEWSALLSAAAQGWYMYDALTNLMGLLLEILLWTDSCLLYLIITERTVCCMKMPSYNFVFNTFVLTSFSKEHWNEIVAASFASTFCFHHGDQCMRKDSMSFSTYMYLKKKILHRCIDLHFVYVCKPNLHRFVLLDTWRVLQSAYRNSVFLEYWWSWTFLSGDPFKFLLANTFKAGASFHGHDSFSVF